MEFLINFFSTYGYFAVFGVLILCGFGLPIPEDVTLVSGGVISGLGYTNVHIMLVVSMIGVLSGDSIMYWLGRIYGTKILRAKPLRKLVTLKRLRSVRHRFETQGNRLLFLARFLPGLRAVVYLISGITRKVSFGKFVFIDFCAAIISVPIWVYLGDLGAKNLDWLHEQIRKGQMIIWIILIAIAAYMAWKYLKNKKHAKKTNG